MNDMQSLLTHWTKATANLKYGVQRVFHDTFVLAANGKTHLVYGADYRNGNPCLVNTVGTMLTTGGGEGVPSANFGEVVSLFDRINTALESSGVNDSPGLVSPLAAEVFLKNFAPLKDGPEPTSMPEAIAKQPYREPSDEQIARDMVMLMQGDLEPCGEINYQAGESMDNIEIIKPESRPTPDWAKNDEPATQ